jgi:hypothetical protein
MRRTSFAVLVAAALLAAPATAAPRAATLSDPRGDWAVPSEDVVAARLEGVVSSAGRSLKATLALAAPPDGATTYYLAFVDGSCESWELSVQGLGTPAQSAVLTHFSCGATSPATVTGTAVPATATVRGTTVEFSTPYVLGMRRGTKVAALLAAAAVRYLAFGVGTDWDDAYRDGDWAQGSTAYVLP